jgi:F-type H+-transporting ATPase subunit b
MLWLATEDPSLIDPNPGLMFWTLITFAIVLYVLRRYAWKPIQQTIDARRKAISDNLDAAEKTRADAQQALDEYRHQLAESRREAGKIVEQARRQMDERRAADIAALEADKQRRLEQAKAEIEAETRRSLSLIKSQIAELTVAATEKVVKRTLDEQEQRRLIDDALSGVDLSELAQPEPTRVEER